MITLHFQLIPQYKYELFHIYFTRFHCTGRNELNKLTLLPMCGFIAQLVEHRTGITEVMGSNPVEALIFFRLLLSNCLNWKIYCDDHTSLSSHTAVQIWIISYIYHIPVKLVKRHAEDVRAEPHTLGNLHIRHATVTARARSSTIWSQAAFWTAAMYIFFDFEVLVASRYIAALQFRPGPRSTICWPIWVIKGEIVAEELTYSSFKVILWRKSQKQVVWTRKKCCLLFWNISSL